MKLKDAKPGQIITLNRPGGKISYVYNLILSRHKTGLKTITFGTRYQEIGFIRFSVWEKLPEFEFRLAELDKPTFKLSPG